MAKELSGEALRKAKQEVATKLQDWLQTTKDNPPHGSPEEFKVLMLCIESKRSSGGTWKNLGLQNQKNAISAARQFHNGKQKIAA